MNNLAVKPMVLSGIEWDIDKEFHYGIENAKYVEAIINDTKQLPIKDGDIQFADNVWNLKPYYIYKKTDDLRFSFKEVPKQYVVIAKFFILLSLLDSNEKVTTLHRYFSEIKVFLKYLDEHGIPSVESVYNNTIQDFMKTVEHRSLKSRIIVYWALNAFFKFVKANYSYTLHIDFSVFDEKNELRSILRKTQENTKTPDIPKDYYNKIVSLLIKSMRDDNLKYKYRAIACVYVILSQTGLRILEITSLEIDSLKSIRLKNLDSIAYFLTYKAFKSAGKKQEFISTEIFANELTKEAFETLLMIRESCDNKDDNTFLYLPNTYTKDYPANDVVVRQNFYGFIDNYSDFAKCDASAYPELSCIKYNGHQLVIPVTKQFRVHVCTELYYRNVPLLYIKKYMCHLCEFMMGYYVRPKSQKQEDVEYSNRLLHDLVANEVSLLGNDSVQIKNNIDKFIADGKFNMNTDIDTIIEALNCKFIIRAKRGGVCIKTSIRDCAKDARTNEMFCAYNICPNLFHLYYMADISYADFKLTQITFFENDKNGFKLQASKELNKLKDICTRRLTPELDDLKKHIQEKGVEEILSYYPNLGNIIMNYDAIKEEITVWTKKKY